MAMGASRRVAKESLKAAMTSEGAPSVCAKRMKIEAVETARIAINSAKGRRRRVGCSVALNGCSESTGCKLLFQTSNFKIIEQGWDYVCAVLTGCQPNLSRLPSAGLAAAQYPFTSISTGMEYVRTAFSDEPQIYFIGFCIRDSEIRQDEFTVLVVINIKSVTCAGR